MSSIGSKIREARLQRGLTQGDLAEDLVTPSMISQIESDKAKPSYTLLTTIANRLGVPVEHFLNELEDQFTLASYLRLAEYHLLLNQPHLAEQALLQVNPPAPPGLDYQDYHMYYAKVHRLQGQPYEAIHLLEDLREQALRHQDVKLLFAVCKESGYVEFSLKNFEGAMHEWRKALKLGESLRTSGDSIFVDVAMEVSEIQTRLHQIALRRGDRQSAEQYAQDALESSKDLSNIRAIVKQLVENGVTFLDGNDSGKAKSVFEKAITVLNTVRMVDQSMLARSYVTALDESNESDPWADAAMAIASVNPHAYIDSELRHAQALIEQDRVGAALARLHRCVEVLNKTSPEAPGVKTWESGTMHRLNVSLARAYIAGGEVEKGLELFRNTANALEDAGLTEFSIYTHAQWLQMAVDLGQHDLALTLTTAIQNLVAKQKRPPVGV